jgi:N-acetylglucosamine kinase-like BadF-type ATPase
VEAHIMPQFDPEVIQVMRSVLDDVMNKVPLEISGTAAKAYLAEAILKAAAQGHTSYNELLTAATEQIQTMLSMVT